VALHLHQQTRLGDGFVVKSEKLRKPGATAFAGFATPRLIGDAGATNSDAPGMSTAGAAVAKAAAAAAAAPDPPAAATHAAWHDANGACAECDTAADDDVPDAAAADGTTTTPATGKLPVAKSKAGKEAAESCVAQGRLKRAQKHDRQAAAQNAFFNARCEQSENRHWCRLDPKGCATCMHPPFRTQKELDAHIAANAHTEGACRPFPAGVAHGRGSARDRDINAANKALTEAVGASGAMGASTTPTLQPAEGFTLTYADKQACEQDPPSSGWARAQRLPQVRCTVEQIEFIVEAYTIGEHKTWDQVKLSPASANELMGKVGTSACAAEYRGHPYFGADLGKPPLRP
jgi:hypothetical protein